MKEPHCLISSCLSSLFGKKLKQNETEIEYKLVSSLDDTNSASQLKHPNISQLLDELKLSEKSLHEAENRYLIITKGNKPILLAWFQVFVLTYRNFNSFRKNSFFNSVLTHVLKLKKIRLLFLGNNLKTYDPGFIFDKGELNEKEAIEIIHSAIEKLSKQENISASLIKESSLSVKTVDFLLLSGYKHPIEDIVMNLEIQPEWKSFEDYQNNLSRKYASRAKKIRNSAKELVLKKLSADEIEAHSQTLEKLLSEVVQSQSFSLGKPDSAYFVSMSKLQPDAFHLYAYFLEDEPVAFYSAFVSDDTFDIQYVGFDYRLNEVYQLYFNIMFDGVAQSISLKKKYLRLGRTSLDAKANLGALPQYMASYIKAYNSPDWVLELFSCYFSSTENDKWKERNPLKQKNELVKEIEAFA